MMTPRATRRRGHTGAVRRGPAFRAPTRYDKASTTPGRGKRSVPLVIDGITHYSTAEAAERLGLKLSTVKDAIATGTLAYRAVGPRLNMVPEPALEEYKRKRLGRRGRPKGAKNKPKASTPPDTPAAGREDDR